MSAQKIEKPKNSQNHMRAPSGGRLILSESIPLPAPLCIRIEPAQICNFRCEFCPVSLDSFQKQLSHKLMDYDLFLSIVENIKNSFGHVKNIMLLGIGESLIHPRIADMVSEITKSNIADTVEITTNASLLTHELSDALVAAGLSLIRISVNGLSADDYQAYCGTKVDFDAYVNNIAYLYSHKGQTKIYVKILNYMVKSEELYQKFVHIFKPISDIINVENLIETSNDIDFQKIADNDIQFNQTQSNTILQKSKICSLPFYTLQIYADGTVYPCCDFGVESIGNVKTDKLKKIWMTKAAQFQRRMLDGVEGIPFCDSCASMKYRVQPEDVLDSHASDLKLKYDILLRDSASF